MPALAHKHNTHERDALINSHLDLARRLARKMARRVPPNVRFDELESAAFLGLTEAANRFDPKRGEPFVAYAAKRVRGAILDELRRNDVLTRRGRESARRLADATRAVEAKVGRPATSDEIATQMGVTVEAVASFRSKLQTPALVPLDDPRDLPRATSEDAPDVQFVFREQKRALATALAALPERDLMIISMYYQDSLTLKEIGDIMGVTESRVCQLRSRALARLRKAIDTDE